MSSRSDTARIGARAAAELHAGLEAALGTPIETLEREPYEYQTSYAIEALHVRLADGRELRLLAKDLGAPSDTALLVKPAFLHDPLRELAVYRDVLAGRRLGTAHCYGTVADPGSGRYWVFLEHVHGDALWQVGELEVWRDVARWLAGLHARCRGVTHERLVRYDRALYETWLERALAGEAGPRLERLAAGYGRVVDRLLALPTTFLHGELYASNVLVERRDGATRVCPIDWEMAGVGPDLLDLAALTAGDWGEDERIEIALAYHEAAPSPPPVDEFLEALECCRLHVALQWLGWSPGWSPPAEHVRDWLGAALRSGERLGLT